MLKDFPVRPVGGCIHVVGHKIQGGYIHARQ